VNSIHTLVVVSHVVHYRHSGRLSAYGPYAREIDIWADLFPQLTIAAPLRMEEPPPDCIPFTRSNITIEPQMEAGGDTWRAKIGLAAALPSLIVGLSRTLSGADAIHVRCPGSLGLLGVLLAPLFSRRLIAKYAGQWDGYAGEQWTSRLERYLLRSRWWRGPVTVYGAWADQPEHVIPFFTSMMSSQQVARAAAVAAGKRIGSPLRVLYSGMLERRKRVDALIEAVKISTDGGLPLEVAVVGDGPERQALLRRTNELGLGETVRFIGALPFERALEWYEWADCLVLPSRHSEGWPKVIAEAMAYGVVCMGVAHGQVPAMLQHGGVLLREGTPEEIAGRLRDVARDPEEARVCAERASRWARQHSLEGLKAALGALLTDRWQLPLAERRETRESVL
jgi:glycosyltransferase involved in cell wall biosynthesis